MAPTLRNSTRNRTIASAKAARNVGYVRRARGPPTRRQMYTRTKGLVSWTSSKDLDAITASNSTNSPLLRLPAELRNMIFKHASTASRHWLKIRTYGRGSERWLGAREDDRYGLAINLPRTCRQIYAETATLMYSQNCFGFQKGAVMTQWLEKRILAQREAIRWLMLPGCMVKSVKSEYLIKTCPKVVKWEKDGDWLRCGECLCSA